MVILCIVDVSLSMMMDQGSAEKDDGTVTGYDTAVTILGKLLREIAASDCEEDVTVYRGSNKVEGVPFDEIEETLFKNKSLSGALSMGAFFRDLIESKAVKPTDTIILFTDVKTYKADIDHFSPCNICFVNVFDHSSEFSAKQASEVLEVSNMSLDPVSKIVRKDHFGALQIADSSEDDVVAMLMKRHFNPDPHTVSFGYFQQKFKLSPHSPSIPTGGLQIVGFVKATSLMNAPTISHHKVVPIVPLEHEVHHFARKEEETENAAVTPNPKNGGKRPVPVDAETSSEGSDTPTKKMEYDDSDEEKTERRAKKMEKRMRKFHVAQRYTKRRLRVLHRMQTLPLFLDIVSECLADEDMVAICCFQTGQYSILNAIKSDDDESDESNLFLSILPMNKCDFQSDFNELVMEPLDNESKEPSGVAHWDLHVVDKEGVPPSYDSNYRCWTTSQGISTDVQKLVRLLRKLPDKHYHFYQEVNSFRDYAILLGLTDFLKEMASILIKESGSMNEVAQKHAKYVATWFEKTIDPTDYTNIPAL